MKKITQILVIVFTSCLFAQNGINYKAIIKDSNGNVLVNDLVTIQFSINETAANGTTIYQESHTPSTDNNGIIIVNIGEGTPISGLFDDIDWANEDHFLNVQVNTGSGLVDLGTTEFKPVPYALTSKTSEKIEYPYFDSGTTPSSTAAFHIHNESTNATFGVVGTTGAGAEILPANRAGVFGYSTNAHGVYGRSENSFYAGVQGVSNSATGYGVLGYGFGGGIGGYFYTTSNGQAALTTGTGNVGIGTQMPEEKLHVAGNMLLQSNVGQLRIGFPNNGNQWALSTFGSGADLQFRSKPNENNAFTTRFRMRQGGEFQIGSISTLEAWLHILQNSSNNKQHILLDEIGNDYARIGFTNTAVSGSNWDIAGLPATDAANARLNFYFRNANGAANRMVVTGDGQVGINGSPTARLHIHQRSQTVGTGLRFSDNTANQDWDITHGFALRFHYGGSLRGFINANTGAYTQSSDARLKSNIQELAPILDKVKALKPSSYNYNNDKSSKLAIGLIAQEVQKIFPEVVHYSEADDLYGIDYSSFSVVAIKAIQEQQSVIESLENRLLAIENKLKN